MESLTLDQKTRIRNIFDATMKTLAITGEQVDQILSLPYSKTPVEEIQKDTFIRIALLLRMIRHLEQLWVVSGPEITYRREEAIVRWFKSKNQLTEYREPIIVLQENPERWLPFLDEYLDFEEKN